MKEQYEKGLIAGKEGADGLKYNLRKITEANGGKVDPTLLSPGVD